MTSLSEKFLIGTRAPYKEIPLHSNPILVKHVSLLAILHSHIKHNQRQRVQVDIMINLLRCGMMLVVLVSPERLQW
jgi:hypothetical protein